MVIVIRDLVPGANTADQGALVYPQLQAALKSGTDFVVSFHGVQTATSSFVNAAFVKLLHDASFAQIKRSMRIVDSSRQINEMIRSRLEKSALEHA